MLSEAIGSLDEIPQGARHNLTFVWLEQVDDAIANALARTKPSAAAE